MIVKTIDYNGADKVIQNNFLAEWEELLTILEDMPLHLKASDQRGKQGTPIFDPVGTNRFIKQHLTSKGWKNSIPIPKEFGFLGTDIDFGKSGIMDDLNRCVD